MRKKFEKTAPIHEILRNKKNVLDSPRSTFYPANIIIISFATEVLEAVRNVLDSSLLFLRKEEQNTFISTLAQ